MVAETDPVFNPKQIQLGLPDILKRCEKLLKYFGDEMSYKEAYVITKVSWLFIKELGVSLTSKEEAQLEKMMKNVRLYLPQDKSPKRNQMLSQLDIYEHSKKLLDYLKNHMSPQETYVITKATWLLLKKSDYALLPDEEAQVEKMMKKTKKILQEKK